MNARDELAAHFTSDLVADPLLDDYAVEVARAERISAYRAAADIAHAEGNRLYDDSGQRHAQGAWAVRDALRARADEMEQQ